MNPRSMELYRVVAGEVGIYEAVERDCPRSDPRRQDKPDGSWLPKVGPHFPGALSFWTDHGLERYIASGLLHWHAAVVSQTAHIIVATLDGPALYSDRYQVICQAESVAVHATMAWRPFLAQRQPAPPAHS